MWRVFGTRLASDPTIDVKSVQTLMRHKTIAMTMQIYVKPRAIRLREAVAKLSLPSVASDVNVLELLRALGYRHQVSMWGCNLGPVEVLAAMRRRYYVVLAAVAANGARRLSTL